MTPTIDARLGPICEELVGAGITLAQAREAFETKMIATALRTCGTAIRAARRLGVHRNTIGYRLRKGR